MPQPRILSSAPYPTQFSLARDVVIVLGITVGAALVAAHLELNEAVFAFTRHWEHLQIDEWPIALLALALSLMWLAWRRYGHARAELQARQIAEADLAAALKENRELGHQHLRVLEAERKHLARELHDELGQYLNAIKLDAVSMGEGADRGDGAQIAASKRIVQAVDHVYGVVGDMIRRLRPAGLDDLGLLAALESCVDQWRQRLPHTRFTFAAHGELDGLDELTNLTIYRIVQEGLTNSSKHAAAESIDVSLNRQIEPSGAPGEIVLTISDDGRGTDTRERKPGFGLSSMRERVEMLGGRLSIQSGPQAGFNLEARIPAAAL